jgi:crossover junction endodeoxyribonuclease RuvC
MVMPISDHTPLILAIDPGLSGALALVAGNRFVHTEELPRVGNILNGIELAKIVSDFGPAQAVIERVHSMPKQGIASAFTFGQAYGTAIGVITGAGLPIAYVTPQKWKAHFRLRGHDKSFSAQKAIQIYPAAAPFLSLKKHHNRAEAILLARYFIDMTQKGEFV